MILPKLKLHKIVIGIVLVAVMACFVSLVVAQQNPTQEPGSVPPPVIKKLGNNLVQVGNITIDTQKKELSVPGKVLPLTSGPPPEPGTATVPKTLEYLATTRNGMKSYESAMELDTDATTFNFALIMLGLEKGRAVLPKGHFDPAVTKGDPVEIWVEWGDRKVRAEELLYNQQSKTVPRMGNWVYTGSVVFPDGRYLAEMDGCLIGFVHDPDTVIENSTGGGIGAFGSINLNPNLQLTANTAVKVTVRALPRQTER